MKSMARKPKREPRWMFWVVLITLLGVLLLGCTESTGDAIQTESEAIVAAAQPGEKPSEEDILLMCWPGPPAGWWVKWCWGDDGGWAMARARLAEK